MGRVRSVSITDLRPDRRNANKGTERGRQLLEKSLEQLGAGRSILADRNDNIIAGNKTHEVAVEMGLPIRIVETDGSELVVVKRTDLDLYDTADTRGRELAYADNRVAEVDFQIDPDVLKEDVANGLDLGWMYSTMEMEQFLRITRVEGIEEASAEIPEVDLDKAEQILEKWNVEPGQIWQAGPHRIMCGDAELDDHWDRLMQGRTASCMWTDPPYGVDYEGRTADKLKIENDKEINLDELLPNFMRNADRYLVEGSPIYMCHPAGRISYVFIGYFEAQGWLFHETLIWIKDSMVLGHSDYHYQHEPILYGWKKGRERFWYSDRKQVSTFEVPRPKQSEDHPTKKPHELIMRQVINSTKEGDLVIDPFAGSGSTLASCHKLGRVCYTMEKAPKYAAVCLEQASLLELDVKLLEDA